MPQTLGPTPFSQNPRSWTLNPEPEILVLNPMPHRTMARGAYPTPGVVERAAEDPPVRRLGAILAPPVIGGGGAVEVRPLATQDPKSQTLNSKP